MRKTTSNAEALTTIPLKGTTPGNLQHSCRAKKSSRNELTKTIKIWRIQRRIGRRLDPNFIGRYSSTLPCLTRIWSSRIISSRDVRMAELLVCINSSCSLRAFERLFTRNPLLFLVELDLIIVAKPNPVKDQAERVESSLRQASQTLRYYRASSKRPTILTMLI